MKSEARARCVDKRKRLPHLGFLAILTFSGSLVAQQTVEPAQPKQPELPPGLRLDRKQAMRLFQQYAAQQPKQSQLPKVAIKPGQACAIPLRNVLAPGPDIDPKMVKKLPPDSRMFPMKEVVVPAPSCDDVK